MVEFVDKTVAAEPKRALSIPDVTELSRSARGYFAETYVLYELTGRGTMAELVPDRGGRMQCDLLVENGIRVEVKSSTLQNRNGGGGGRDSLKFIFTQDNGFVSTQYDFIVAVGFTEDGIMPYIVPPRVVEGQRRFRVRPTDKSHYSKYFDRWDLILEGNDRGERA